MEGKGGACLVLNPFPSAVGTYDKTLRSLAYTLTGYRNSNRMQDGGIPSKLQSNLLSQQFTVPVHML